jgi:hypothetical protein
MNPGNQLKWRLKANAEFTLLSCPRLCDAASGEETSIWIREDMNMSKAVGKGRRSK